MAKFKNNSPHDVYVDLGKLMRVKSGGVIDLVGAHSCPPLTLVPEVIEKPKRKSPPKARSSATSGTI
jgi:hypothetical protein